MEPLSATILILVVTSQNITLAVDSRKTILTSNNVNGAGVMDKIYQTNDYFYAVSGLDSSEDRGFSIHALIHNVLKNFTDFDIAIKKLACDLVTTLKDFFTSMKERSTELFRRFLQYSASGGEIVITKNVGKLPIAYLLDYKIIDGTNIKVVANTWKTDCSKIKEQNQCFWGAIGYTSFLNGSAFSEKDITSDPIIFVKKVMQEGIIRYPDFVSEPINIVQLTGPGARWIEKSATAPNRVC